MMLFLASGERVLLPLERLADAPARNLCPSSALGLSDSFPCSRGHGPSSAWWRFESTCAVCALKGGNCCFERLHLCSCLRMLFPELLEYCFEIYHRRPFCPDHCSGGFAFSEILSAIAMLRQLFVM